MKKASTATRRKPIHKRHESIEAHLHHIDCELEKIMSAAADLQTVVDKIAADVAALQAVPPVTQLVTQTQLDANVASLTDSEAKLAALATPATPSA